MIRFKVRTVTAIVAIAAAGMLVAAPATRAQDCTASSPNPEAFRQTIQDSRTREADLRQKLKGQNGIRVALSLLRRYEALLTEALATVDDMESRANQVQERRCPGWEHPEKMEETALVIKNLKARYKKQRADVAASVARLDAGLNKGQRGTVSVTFD